MVYNQGEWLEKKMKEITIRWPSGSLEQWKENYPKKKNKNYKTKTNKPKTETEPRLKYDHRVARFLVGWLVDDLLVIFLLLSFFLLGKIQYYLSM